MGKNKITKLSPIQALTQGVINKKVIRNQPSDSGVILIEPGECEPWTLHDRCSSWLSEKRCKDIINSIEKNGQKIPILVRANSQENNSNLVKYEIIAGARRWYACKKLGIKIKASLVQANDKECAILMHVENKDRADISDFERAISLRNQLMQGIFSNQEEMSKQYGFSKSYLSKILKAAKLIEYNILNKFLTDYSSISMNRATLLSNALEDKEKYKIIYTRIKNLTSEKKVFKSFSDFTKDLLDSLERSNKANLIQSYKNKAGNKILITKATKNKVIIEMNREYLEKNKNEAWIYLEKAFKSISS
ncbi:MAG: ParB/RepB/Spo0J family partition protein [Legionellales bacterium]|nr:ParB/RepB/Spo0J family partition protein [Legionellales bacterium]